MKTASPDVLKTISDSVPHALKYAEEINSVFSALAFGLAIACASTENPRFYSWLSFFFILALWYSTLQRYRRRLRLLRIAENPAMNVIPVIKRSVPFIVGWCVLGLVMLGALDKNGWNGLTLKKFIIDLTSII